MRLIVAALGAGVLASCGGFNTLAPALNSRPESPGVFPAAAFNTIYSFKGASNGDGSSPTSGVTFAGGELYGTTSEGGSCQGTGTAFKATLLGSESVIHAFCVTPDGKSPQQLLSKSGFLYGTAATGGNSSRALPTARIPMVL